jgi:hypothetical protein
MSTSAAITEPAKARLAAASTIGTKAFMVRVSFSKSPSKQTVAKPAGTDIDMDQEISIQIVR